MSNYPDFFQEHRIEKRKHLLDSGINPYPYTFSSSHSIEEMIEKFDSLEAEEASVSCSGRLLSSRKMGKSWFLDIIDRGYQFQL